MTLLEVIEKVGNKPFQISNYPQYILLSKEQDAASSGEAVEEYQPSNDTEITVEGPLTADACSTMISALGATSDVWLPLLKYKAATLDALGSVEDAQALLDLFTSSRKDYFSLPLLAFQVNTILKLNEQEKDKSGQNVVWTDQMVRQILQDIMIVGTQHISKSDRLWNPWIKWELEQLEVISAAAEEDSSKESEKQEAIARIDELFLNRLKQIHSSYGTTSDLYSPFVSTYFSPTEYESKLIAATKARELSVKQLNWREGNPKRVREHLELRAESGGIREWKQYLSWELGAKKPQKRLIAAIYERAVDFAARERWNALVSQAKADSQAAKEAVMEKETTLRELWEEYLAFAARQSDADLLSLLNLAKRACRCLPEVGAVWAFYMRAIEKASTASEEMDAVEWEETVEDTYSRVMAMDLIQSSIDDFIPVVLTRASWSRRRCFVEEDGETVIDQDLMADVVQVVEEAIATIRKTEPGDAKMRLESFLSTFYLSLPLADSALDVLQSATKFYKSSYLAWLNYIDVLIHERKAIEARRVFKDASQRKGLDWPEAIWERWITFEYQFGSLDDIEKALGAVKEHKKAEDIRRIKAWEAHAKSQSYSIDPNLISAQPAAEASSNAIPTQRSNGTVGMEVDAAQSSGKAAGNETHLKRKRSSEENLNESPVQKKSKSQMVAPTVVQSEPVDQEMLPGDHAEQAKANPDSNTNPKEPVKLKRDRENTSVLVSQLPQSTVRDDVQKLFKDCGEIREIQIKPLPNELVATVEFMDKDSIPAALTRDKKRIHGAEVIVNPAENTTLWVTNFREGMDDAAMRGMFEKYGTILDIRWPSKSIKTTRRYCYVQFTTVAAAHAALYLNGFEMEPGMKLSVLVSDPTRKKQRTDTGARELRVTGIVKSVTKPDLEKLFGEHGELKDIRLLPAAGNNQTAFVEYETEEAAQSALALNNHMLKGRRLAVIMADSRLGRPSYVPGAREEANNRSIRIRGVPSGTQEAILQQALEKMTSVVRLHLVPERNEAILEVENAAVAGKLLLEHPTITFNDQTLTLSEEVRPSAVATRGRGRGRGTFGLSHSRQTERQAESAVSPPSSPEVLVGKGTPRGHRGGRSRGGGKVGIGGSRAGIGMRSRKMDTDADYDDAEMKDREPTASSGPGAPAAAITDRTPKSQADFRQMLGL
ncbi:hypothetical protein CPB86DRAFT_769315 [Serendipita vermifera]|nr:hypothetical protein CPB86DRAFT_769315 [Serendipita vermifera]